MKISEKQLTNIIMESVKKNLFEQELKNTIKQMVRESFESFGGLSQFEAEDGESEPKKLTKSDSGKADFNHENQDEEERRAQVEKFFNKDGVDIAPYAYKLYHVEAREGEDTNDMKNARSKFMKCLNHEPNEAGYPYSFESSEVNKLQSMISSNQLNEGKARVRINETELNKIVAESVKKVLNEIGDTPKGMYAMSAVQGRAMARRKKAKEAGDDEGVKKQQKTLDTANNRIGSAIQDLKKKHKKIYGSDFEKADVQGFRYGFEKEKQNGK